MSNVTLNIQDDVLRKARKMAAERNTTLSDLVGDSLRELAARDKDKTEETIAALRDSFDAGEIRVGRRSWTREDLHAK